MWEVLNVAYVMGCVVHGCLACLVVCQQDYTKSNYHITLTLGERMGHGPTNNQLNFGVDAEEFLMGYFF